MALRARSLLRRLRFRTLFAPPGGLMRPLIIGGVVLAAMLAVPSRTTFVVSVPLALVAFVVLGRFWLRVNQGRRDRRTARIAAAVARGEHATYALYLRPFATTERMGFWRPPKEFGRTASLPDLETVIAEALEPETPLIALGQPGEITAGAGRHATPDQRWRETFRRLAIHAELILALPPDRTGHTSEEITWLRANGLLGRGIMVMPPADLGRGEDHWPAYWTAACAVAAGQGLQLPAYRPEGLLFTLEPGGAPRGGIELCWLLDEKPKLRRALADLRQGRRGLPQSDASAAPLSTQERLLLALLMSWPLWVILALIYF